MNNRLYIMRLKLVCTLTYYAVVDENKMSKIKYIYHYFLLYNLSKGLSIIH